MVHSLSEKFATQRIDEVAKLLFIKGELGLSANLAQMSIQYGTNNMSHKIQK